MTQLLWPDMLGFIWQRFDSYRRQKTQTQQWDEDGRSLKRLANDTRDSGSFVAEAMLQMGVRTRE